MRIDTSEEALTKMLQNGQVGLIVAEFARKDRVISACNDKIEHLQNTIANKIGKVPENARYMRIKVDYYADMSTWGLPSSWEEFVEITPPKSV